MNNDNGELNQMIDNTFSKMNDVVNQNLKTKNKEGMFELKFNPEKLVFAHDEISEKKINVKLENSGEDVFDNYESDGGKTDITIGSDFEIVAVTKLGENIAGGNCTELEITVKPSAENKTDTDLTGVLKIKTFNVNDAVWSEEYTEYPVIVQEKFVPAPPKDFEADSIGVTPAELIFENGDTELQSVTVKKPENATVTIGTVSEGLKITKTAAGVNVRVEKYPTTEKASEFTAILLINTEGYNQAELTIKVTAKGVEVEEPKEPEIPEFEKGVNIPVGELSPVAYKNVETKELKNGTGIFANTAVGSRNNMVEIFAFPTMKESNDYGKSTEYGKFSISGKSYPVMVFGINYLNEEAKKLDISSTIAVKDESDSIQIATFKYNDNGFVCSEKPDYIITDSFMDAETIQNAIDIDHLIEAGIIKDTGIIEETFTFELSRKEDNVVLMSTVVNVSIEKTTDPTDLTDLTDPETELPVEWGDIDFTKKEAIEYIKDVEIEEFADEADFVEKMKKLLASKNNYSYLNCGRLLANGVTIESIKKFYNEFVTYGAMSYDDAVFIKSGFVYFGGGVGEEETPEEETPETK